MISWNSFLEKIVLILRGRGSQSFYLKEKQSISVLSTWNPFIIKLDKMIKFLKHFAFTIGGALILSFVFVATILNCPICIFRWLVCKCLAPTFRKDLGKPLNIAGATMALELHGKEAQKPPKCTLVTTVTYKGILNYEEFRELIQTKWIQGTGPDGNLLYPEYQQYIEGFMGYLFWKSDKNFDINNHIKKHVIDKTCSEEECENFVCSVIEDCLNRPYLPKKSPWEFRVIYGYRNAESVKSGNEITVISFKLHHCLGDGFTIFTSYFEGLYNISRSDCGLAEAKNIQKRPVKSKFLSNIVNFVTLPLKICRDTGYAGSLVFFQPRNPWFMTNHKKCGKQLCSRSPFIEISKLKRVKDKFGVSFTSVLLSAISTGIAAAFKSKNFAAKTIPFGIPLPIKNHSPKLRNQLTAALLEIPIEEQLTSLQRLRKTEKLFQFGRHSTIPYLLPVVGKLMSQHGYFFGSHIYKNRSFSMGCSNNAGSGVPLTLNGHDLLSNEFAFGLFPGVEGVGFAILSYCDHLRIVVIAEPAVMTREESKKMLDIIVDEIDNLHRLALSVSGCKEEGEIV